MSIREALYQAETALSLHSTPDAHLEAELLLMRVLEIGRAELYLRLEQPLSDPDRERFWHLVQRRCQHEPTAYILKSCQFYGIDLYIDSRALIPRPETELLVEIALKFARQHFSYSPCLIADVGTGSGAVAVAIALHLPRARIYATDVSAEALEVASINCRRYDVAERVELLQGDLLEPASEPVDMILANLPYVKDSELSQLSPEIRMFEPIIALAGGADGLDKVRQLLPQARERLLSRGLMLFEIGQGQSQAATALVKSYFPAARIELIPDFGGIGRVLKVSQN